MTPEQIEKHRKRFEEIINALRAVRYSLKRDENDEYQQAAVFHMWNGYLLCAENMEVELPSLESKVMDRLDAGYNLGISDCRLKIESQGIKVKEKS